MSEKLTQLIAEINILKKNIGFGSWELGCKLLEIQESKLYLEKYPTWTEFLSQAVEISERSAYRFMRAATNFDKEQIEQWGIRKLDLILQLEEPQQKQIFELHKSTEPVEEIKQVVQQMRQSQPEINKSYAFFAKIEMLAINLTPRIKELQDHLAAAKLDPEWNTYKRRAYIESMLVQIKQAIIEMR